MKTICRLVFMVAIAALLATSVPVCASEMDDRIESSVGKSYAFKTYLKDDHIKVESRDGAVRLTGTVSEEFHKSMAYETVAGMPGVNSVDNRLELEGVSPTPYSDAWLDAKVKAALSFHRSVNAATTEVDVKDGIVTLRGEAAGEAQKELATEYAKDVEGVKDVRNEMIVSKLSKTSDSTVAEDIDDASITAQVKISLLFHRSTSAHNTKVETNAGVVTLYGKARSAAEKDLVTKLSSDINGVKSVNNRMTIE